MAKYISTDKNVEEKVENYVEENMKYQVRNVSPSSHKTSFSGKSCDHTSISDFILRHIAIHYPGDPQEVIYRGLPDLLCYSKKSLSEINEEKYEITNDRKISRRREGGIEINLKFEEGFSLVSELRFIEVKSLSDSLNKHQQKWIRKFADFFDSEIAVVSEREISFYEAESYLEGEKNLVRRYIDGDS